MASLTGDALTAIGFVHEEAGDAPVGELLQTGRIGLAVLDARQLIGRAKLAPADAGIAVIDQGRMGATFADARLLIAAALLDAPCVWLALGMERHAPAAAPDPVMPLDQSGEGRPGRGIEGLGGEGWHRCFRKIYPDGRRRFEGRKGCLTISE